MADEATPKPDQSADLAAFEAELSGFDPGPGSDAGAAGSGASGAAASGDGKEPAKPAEVGSPAPGAKEGAPAPETKYRVGDRDYTLDELTKAGLLEKIVTGANQTSHFQKLHEEAKHKADELDAELKRIRQEQAQPKAQPAAPAKPTQLTKEGLAQITAFFQPRLASLKAGELGPQMAAFADDLPEVAAWLMFRDLDVQTAGVRLAERLAKLEESLTGVSTTAAKYTAEAEAQAFRSRYNSYLDEISNEGRFGKLKESEHRQAFTQFVAKQLAKEDDFSAVTPDLLKLLYGAFVVNLSPELLDALQARAAERGKQAATAAGEGAGKRPAAPAEKSALDKLTAELEDAL